MTTKTFYGAQSIAEVYHQDNPASLEGYQVVFASGEQPVEMGAYLEIFIPQGNTQCFDRSTKNTVDSGRACITEVTGDPITSIKEECCEEDGVQSYQVWTTDPAP